ncbi:hypothetical protein LTR66_011091 [Elasticomyces elasticus]|nr:hypothetical protein LTR66_011091 [Elasticomyces elasticus]
MQADSGRSHRQKVEVTNRTQLKTFIANLRSPNSYFKLKDPSNLTAEHLEKLRNLVNGIDKSRPVNMDALNEKLRNIASTPATESISRSSSVETPGPEDWEDYKEDCLREEKEARDALILDGGRPSHPFDSGFDILKDPGQYAEMISYWTGGWSNEGSGWGIFCAQLGVWRKFRKWQEFQRQDPKDSERFSKYARFVRDYRRKKGLEGDIELHEDPKKQNWLDDWKEYQLYQLRTADRFTRAMKRAEMELELAQKELQAAVEANQPPQSIELIKDFGIAYWQGRKGTAIMDLAEHDILLRWIDQQLPTIAQECGSFNQGSKPFHRSDSAEARTVLEVTHLDHEAAGCIRHQPEPAQHTRKRKRSTDDSTLCPSVPLKAKKSNTATKICEGREPSAISNAPAFLDQRADNRGRERSAALQQQNHAAQPRRSQRIAKLKKEAPVLDLGAVPSFGPCVAQKASTKRTRRAARSPTKRLTSRVVKATDRSLSARCLREKRHERGRPIPPAFELGPESKTPLSEGGLRRSKRIRERYRKALTSAQELPC